MRSLAGLAIALGCGAATAAGAQTVVAQSPAQSLALSEAAFAPKAPLADADPIGSLINRETYAPGVGPVRWDSGQVQLSRSGSGAVDSLRFSVGGALAAPGGQPLRLDRAQYEARAYEVTVVRDWPGALSFDTGRFGVDLSPHAGVGMTSIGGSAEAGATLRLTKRDETTARRLKAMGVADGASFGDQGRWYLFAAASGRAVGLNMLHGDQGWNRAGWTTDPTSTLIGDAQLGVGWRKGAMQTSLGYVHREVKGQHMLWGQDTRPDSMVAFTLSIKPGSKGR